MFRVDAEFVAQAFDVHGDGVGVRDTPPHGVTDFFGTDDSATLFDQEDQQFQFALGELDFPAANPGFVAVGVDMDGSGKEGGGLVGAFVTAEREWGDRGDVIRPGDHCRGTGFEDLAGYVVVFWRRANQDR